MGAPSDTFKKLALVWDGYLCHWNEIWALVLSPKTKKKGIAMLEKVGKFKDLKRYELPNQSKKKASGPPSGCGRCIGISSINLTIKV
jgi:hypothetical protein